MRYAYDLDGTLAHTRAAVYAAYHAVGVTPPKDFYYRPWTTWLIRDSDSDQERQRAEELHDRKNGVYLQIAKSLVRATPLVELFKRCPGAILTGASQEAATEVLKIIGLFSDDLTVLHECTLEMKIEFLRMYGGPGLYFDDDILAVRRIHEEVPEWSTLIVKF